MRPLFLVACLAATLAHAQRPAGTYQGTPWQINSNHALVWGGHPYMPVGMLIDGTVGDAEKASAAGVKDVLVDLPANGAGWSDVFASLNKNQTRFLLRINSLAPMAKGIAVEPQGYRVPDITGPKHVAFTIPDATSAMVLLVDQRDSSITKFGRVPIRGGNFAYDVQDVNGVPHVLLVYPEMVSLEQPDFWDGLDAQRDSLLTSLKKSAPGAGLRGIVNPLGKMLRIPGRGARFVPTSGFFRDELRALLEARYRSVETATKAWTVGAPDFQDFDTLARMVPLWSGYRGVASLWDPATDRLYTADVKRSMAWKDINDCVLMAATRRFRNLVSAVRATTDVPVVQEWAGWAPPYDGSQISIDGVGLRVSASGPSALVDASAKPISSVLRWSRPGWLLATDLTVGGDLSLRSATEQLGEMGARGCFVRGVGDPAVREMDASLAETTPQVLYFPENATNPPRAQRLPGGKWWLPSPANGDRIDLGSKFAAYRLEDGATSFVALWSTAGTVRTILRAIDPKALVFETIDGSDPAPKPVKSGVEVTLTDVPLLIKGASDIPVPDGAAEETIGQFTSLLKALGYERGAVSEEQYYFTEAAKGFERNPGASLVAMRAVLNRSLLKVALYTWIEAESSKSHNFSQIAAEPGCSGRFALEVDSSISPEGGFSASYEVPVRTAADEEIWVAARIPPGYRDSVTVYVAGQPFKLSGSGVSEYGNGYAWYRLGATRLAGTKTTLKVSVDGEGGGNLAIDAILLSPTPFRPQGVQMPLVPFVDATQDTKDGYKP